MPATNIAVGDHHQQNGHPQPKRRPPDAQPFHGDRLKALRTEAGWSRAELAEKIDSDARQVSRFENSKVSPPLDAVIRIAQTFDVTTDCLLLDDAPKRPQRTPAKPPSATASPPSPNSVPKTSPSSPASSTPSSPRRA